MTAPSLASTRAQTRTANLILALGGVSVIVLGLLGVMLYVFLDAAPRPPRAVPFSLVDQHGQPVDETVFRGHPSLVYFGYTNCPEVCPTTMIDLTQWLNALGRQGEGLKAYFFTVDPERDTVEVMDQYVGSFSPRITGVTGSLDEMHKAMGNWSIRGVKEPTSDGDYHMSHSLSLLMVGGDGRLRGTIAYGTPTDAAVAKIRDYLLPSS